MSKADATKRRWTRRVSNQRGVTLVESMIALGLLALGAAAIGDFMTGQIRHSAANHLATTAYALAADEIERIRALPFDEMTGAAREKLEKGVVYGVVSDVFEGVPAANMKTIQVHVSWGSPGGERSVELQTVYAQVTPD